MREFSDKEVQLFNSFQDTILGSSSEVHWEHTENSLYSIETLTRGFVTGLQEDFPATIPTIFRTGDKFHVPKETLERLHDDEASDNDSFSCLLCKGILDTQSEAPCSLQATKFSQMVSSKGPQMLKEEQLISRAIIYLTLDVSSPGTEPVEKRDENCNGQKEEENGCSGEGLCSEGGGSCGSKGSSAKNKGDLVAPGLADEVQRFLCYSCRILASNLESVPEFLCQEAGKRLRRAEMKNEIQDFLL